MRDSKITLQEQVAGRLMANFIICSIHMRMAPHDTDEQKKSAVKEMDATMTEEAKSIIDAVIEELVQEKQAG